MSNVKKTDNIIDLDLSSSARTKIRINGDNSKVLELNLSDIGIITRLNDAYPKLNDLQAEVTKVASAEISDDDMEALSIIGEQFKVIDQKMRDIVDKIFDFPVCDICCDGGSMYDPVAGQYRFEYIIENLSKLYGDTINAEYKRMKNRMETHTAKYTKKKKRG